MNDKLKACGKIRISVEDKKTGARTILKEYDNAVTQFGKELFLSTSAAMRMNYDLGLFAGNRLSCTTLGQVNSNSYYASQSGAGLACYLLNLDDGAKSALTPMSHSLSLVDGYGIKDDVLVGYGCNARTSSSAKEGVITIPDADLVCNPTVSARAWKFPAGIASGTTNAIQIGASLGFNTSSPSHLRGGSIWSGLSEADLAIADNVAPLNAGYLRPGIKKGDIVVTGDTEILIGDATNSLKARIVYDFVKGTKTILSADDARYDLDLGAKNISQYVVGDYFCYVSAADNHPYIVKMSTWTPTVLATSNFTGRNFFVKDGYLYCAVNSTSTMHAYKIETATRDSSKNVAISSLGLPSNFGSSYNNLSIQNFGEPESGKYFICVNGGNNATFAVICTDIYDVAGTTVDIVGLCPVCTNVKIGDTVYLFATDIQSSVDVTYSNTINTQQFLMGRGLWFSKTWGSMISYRVLDSAISKPEDKEIIVNYYYQFV